MTGISGDLAALASAIAALLAGFLLWRRLRQALARKQSTKRAKPIIIDGSNVMHWDGGKPRIAVLQSVVDRLQAQGYAPGVVFDANAGYLLTGRYQHDHALSRALGLPARNVMVVQKGTPADPTILQAARDMNARVVSNDRFRDWAGDFPEIRRKGFLVRGRFRSGHLHLNLPAATPRAAETPRN